MGIIARARALLSGGWGLAQKAAPYVFLRADGQQPVWSANDYGSYVGKGFERNALVNAAVMYKVRAIALTRMWAYREVDGEDNLEKLPHQHRLNHMFTRPNPHMSWVQFEGLNTVYLNLAGNAYVYVERGSNGQARALYPLRPDRVYLVPEQDGVRGYLYIPQGRTSADGVPFLPDDLIHVKLPNALDDYEGLGYGVPSLRAAAQSVDVDNNLTQFLKQFMQSGAIPSGILKFETMLDERVVGRIKSRWREQYGGYQNWSDVGVLDQGGTYQRIGANFEEMGFESIDERNEARVLSVLGVPGILLDTRIAMKSSTYANKQEARRAFWEDSFPYELSLWDNEYEYALTDERIRVVRDLSGVPALRKNVSELVTASKTLWTMGMPLNQALQTVGLKGVTVEGGDVGYLPIAVQPVGAPTTDTVMAAAARLASPEEDEAQTQEKAVRPAVGKAEAVQSWCVMARFADAAMVGRYRDEVGGDVADADIHLTLTYGEGLEQQAVAGMPETPAALVVTVDEIDQFDTPDGWAVYLRVKPDEALIALQRGICEAQQAAGLSMSEYSLVYKPHITLGYFDAPIAPRNVEPFTLVLSALELSDAAHTVRLRRGCKSDVAHLRGVNLLEPLAEKKSRWPAEVRPELYKTLDDIPRRHERDAAQAAAAALEGDRRAVMAIIADTGREAMSRKSTIDWIQAIPALVRYGLEQAAEGWREQFQGVMLAVIGDNGNYWSAALGFQFNVRNVAGEAWFQNYMLTFSQPIQQTSLETIQQVLAQGQAEGWSIRRMQDALKMTFDQWISGDVSAEDYEWISNRLPPHRTELIARTETTRVQNAGSQALFTEWGVAEKSWLSTFDNRTRDTHRAADGQRRAIDAPFNIGGFEMMYPGDMSMGAPIREAANCRCALLPE